MDDSDPAFLGLAQSSGSAGGDLEEAEVEVNMEGGDGSDGDDAAGLEYGEAAGAVGREPNDAPVDFDTEDVWITSLYEELDEGPGTAGSVRVIATASVNVAAHRVQCAYFSGEAAVGQALDHLDIIRVSRSFIL